MINSARTVAHSISKLAAVWLVLMCLAACNRLGGEPVRTADVVSAQDGSSLVFLYAYEIEAGREDAFFAGYRKHLDWHAQHKDSLSWLGWMVDAGEGMGLFVDGVFGVSGAAMDNRAAPAADAADAALNVTPYARPVYRYTYRGRPDLSRAARLEVGRPAALQHVAWLTPAPGSGRALEQALRSLRQSKAALADYAVYERIAGGSLPGILLIVQYDNWTKLSELAANPLAALERLPGGNLAQVESEIWTFRPDLTYRPRSE